MPPDPATLRRRSDRLTLRLLRPADRDAWVAAHDASADHFAPWMPAVDPAMPTWRRFELQLARAQDGARTDTHYALVAELHDEPGRPLAAFLSLSQIFRGPFRNAYAAWRVALPYARQGVGRESVDLLLDIAFAPTDAGGVGLHRVQANVIPTNVASLALARACGFRQEGYAVRYLEIAGEWQDHVMFAKLSDEHVAARPGLAE